MDFCQEIGFCQEIADSIENLLFSWKLSSGNTLIMAEKQWYLYWNIKGVGRNLGKFDMRDNFTIHSKKVLK